MHDIIIHEVGPRDGLQMEKQIVPLEKKLEWIRGLINTGIDIIQVGSFVHIEKMPQMATTDQLFIELAKDKPKDVILSALVLNEKGLERGMKVDVDMFCMGVSASETHSKKNTNMSVSEATDRIIAIAQTALDANKKVQVSVQSAFGCGFEGRVPMENVIGIARKFVDAGLRSISLADTAGHATPDKVEQLFSAVNSLADDIDLTCHFHNTYGMGLANCYAAMKVGVKYYESSVAGLGGCPFTKIAGGNVCTEDLVHMLQHMNIRGDIRLDPIIGVANDVAAFFNREMPGAIYRTGVIPGKKNA
jgi:hydroxymethylglutaryl-CoA lyase